MEIMQGKFLSIKEAKREAQVNLEELYKKAERIELYTIKKPNDIHAQKKLKGMYEYIEYLKGEISNFENIERIVGVNEKWNGGMDLQ